MSQIKFINEFKSSVFLFYVRTIDFAVYFMPADMSLGVSIMMYSGRPLLRATYEVNLLRTSCIGLHQKFETLQELNPGPLRLES